VTGLWAGQPRFQFLAGARGFSLLQNTHISSGTHILILKGYYRACSPAVNCLGCEADDLLPPSAKGKNECSSTSTPTNLNGVYKHNSTFTSYTYVLH